MILICKDVQIAPTSSAIKSGGLAEEPVSVTLHIRVNSAEELIGLHNLRGHALSVLFTTPETRSVIDKIEGALK